MTPSHEIHNIDTMDIRCPYTELMFVSRDKKKGRPHIGDAPMPVGDAY